jgi:uncharacterized membrane protein
VYVPHAYAITGKVFMVRKEKVKQLTNVSAGEAMKFAVSGGVTHISELPAVVHETEKIKPSH